MTDRLPSLADLNETRWRHRRTGEMRMIFTLTKSEPKRPIPPFWARDGMSWTMLPDPTESELFAFVAESDPYDPVRESAQRAGAIHG